MKTTGAVSKNAPNACAASEMETEAKLDDETADGLPELVVDTEASAKTKSNGVGSTDSIDSGLAGDHSSPEHEHGCAAARSNRRRPRASLKMPPYPGFEWVPSQGENENGYYYNYDKLTPSGDAAMEYEIGAETTFGSHIVYVHVNVGETLSVRVGNDVQHIPGPATVRMVTSHQAGPPLPLRLEVPPGHIVQQVVDEYGTLRHMVLSPQTPPPSNSAASPFQMVNMTHSYTSPNVQFLDANGMATFYDGTYSYAVSPDPSNAETVLGATVPGAVVDLNDVNGISAPTFQSNQEFQEPSLNQNTKEPSFRRPCKQYQTHGIDDQTRTSGRDGVENQFRSVPPRVGGRRKRNGFYRGPTGVLSEANGRYPTSAKSARISNERNRTPTKVDGPNARNHGSAYHNGYSQQPITGPYRSALETVTDEPTSRHPNGISNHDDDESTKITEMLSRIPPPQVCDISSCAAFVQWQPFDCSEASANGGSFPQIDASEFTYEVHLYEHGVDGQLKQNHRCQAELYPQKWLMDLKPACEYFVRLRASLEERGIRGEPSTAVAFKTKAAPPRQPDAPTVQQRSKTWVMVTWQQPPENGSKIISYHLQIDNGDGQRDKESEASSEAFEEIYSGLALEYKVQNLQPATSYQIRLAASNSIGKSEYSDVLTMKTSGGTPSEPEPPTLLEAMPTALMLKWKRREGDDEFQLLMEDADTGYQPIIKTQEVVHTVRNLVPSHDYRFRLTASNDDGCGPMSSVATFRTLPPKPPAPSKPVVKGVVSDRATIAWESEKVEGLSYVLEMAEAASNDWTSVYNGTEKEFEVSDLEPGSSYQFRVSRRGEGGLSEFSEELQLMTPAVPPGQCGPPTLREKPEPTALHLTWTPPQLFGGLEITEYELSIGQPTNPFSFEPASPSTNTGRIIYKGPGVAYTVSTGLQPGCAYVFRVRAYNAFGTGPWSEPFECQTSAAPPECPQGLRLAEVSSRSAYLMWEPPEFNNGAPVTEYRLYRAYRKLGSIPHSPAQTPAEDQPQPQQASEPTTSPEIADSLGRGPKALKCFERQISSVSNVSDDDCVFSTNSDVGAMVEAYVGPELRFEAESLTPATEYAFCVQAVNEAGESRLSNALFCRTPADVPDSPTIVKMDPMSSSEILVCWDAPADNGSPIISYDLEILPAKLEECGSGLMFPTALPSHCRQFAVGNLAPATAYRFRIQAINDVGAGGYSSVAEATTLPPPPPPPKVDLASATHTSLKLKWHCDSTLDPEAITYTLEMENKTGTFSPLAADLASRSFKMVRLNEATSYRFRIRACSAMGGVGQWSDTFVFTTLKAPPAAIKYAPKANDITQTSCEIDWQPAKLLSSVNTNDKVYYDLQIRNVASSSNSTEGAFETIYKGPSTTYRLTGLTPGAAYKLRVCSIRISESGDETESAPSPISTFSTIPPPSLNTTAGVDSTDGAFGRKALSEAVSLLCGSDHQISDRQWACLILVAFSLLALLVAFILQRFIPEGSTMDDGASPVDPHFVDAAR